MTFPMDIPITDVLILVPAVDYLVSGRPPSDFGLNGPFLYRFLLSCY